MTTTRSKVRNGVLRIGGTDIPTKYIDGTAFTCSARATKVTPTFDKDGDDIEVLCGDKVLAPYDSKFTLDGTIVQQFDQTANFQQYCYTNNGLTKGFYLKLNDVATTPVFYGLIVIHALEEGGDVGSDPGDVDFSFEGVGWYNRYVAP